MPHILLKNVYLCSVYVQAWAEYKVCLGSSYQISFFGQVGLSSPFHSEAIQANKVVLNPAQEQQSMSTARGIY